MNTLEYISVIRTALNEINLAKSYWGMCRLCFNYLCCYANWVLTKC